MNCVVHVVDATIASDNANFNALSDVKENHVVIRIAAMCNGIMQMVSDIKSSCTVGTISQLIIYGHGAPGVMGITMGKDPVGMRHRGGISAGVLSDIHVDAKLQELRPYFARGAMVVLRGCNTAQGPKGDKLITSLARMLGVRVSASDAYQRVGRSDLIGNIKTAQPDGTISIDSYSGKANLRKLPMQERLLFIFLENFRDAED